LNALEEEERKSKAEVQLVKEGYERFKAETEQKQRE